MDPQPTQPRRNEDAPTVWSNPAANSVPEAPEDNPAGKSAEDGHAATNPEDGGLLEIPLQEGHHRVISAFMAEHQRDASPHGIKMRSWFPGFHDLRKLAGRLKRWWG